MWCRSDARLWHYYSAFSARGVFQTLVWHQYYYSAFSARGVFQTLVWHQYYYSAFSARGVFQTLVWHQYYYFAFSAQGVFQTLVWHPALSPLCRIVLVNLSMYFMLAFVISYVRTVLRVLSKYSLAC